MRHRQVRRHVIALAALATSASLTVAQPMPDDNAGDATPNTNTLGIFVRDSAVAGEKLALAERMERAHEWDTSAEVYQEVVDRFADRVIATHTDAQGRTDRYGGVAAVVQDRIAAWPAEGQRAYLNRYETPAAQLLASIDSDDEAALAGVINRYFITPAGRDAALRLVDRYFNDGQFVAAASLADRLIDHHPGIDATRKPMLLLRAALAWHLAGDAARAQARADTLKQDFADAHAMLGGVDRKLSEVAAAELAHAPNADATATAGHWPEPFGTPDHAAVSHDPAADLPGDRPREWARLLSIALEPARPAMPSNGDPNAALIRQQWAGGSYGRQRELGAMTGILPAVDGDAVFFQDNARVYARSLATGAALPGWLQTYPNDDGRFRVADAVSTPRGAQMAVTLAGRYVLAILAQPDANAQMMGGPGNTRGQVVCLDRNSGALLWSAHTTQMQPAPSNKDDAARPAPAAPPDGNAPVIGPDAGAANEDAESLLGCNPVGSVLVANDAAYVVVRGGRTAAIIDSYLVCLDLADGSPRWVRHLASGNSMRSQYGFDPGAPLTDAANSHLAYADGRIYACTDLGAVVAVDAADGSIAWIAAYPRPRVEGFVPGMNMRMQGTSRVETAFSGNPVIVRDGKVLTLPVDSDYLFVHDAFDGRELARVRIKGQPRGDDATDVADVLGGVSGDRVVLASSRAITTLDWKKITAPPANAAAAPNEIAFDDATVRRFVLRKPNYEDNAIRGRIGVTDHSIFVPTAWRLMRFDLDTLVLRDSYPANEDWDQRRDESPGNVTIVGDQILVAGQNRLSVFSELSQVRQRLDAQIAAAPDRALPRVQYAETLFNAGRTDEALGMIDQAIQRLPTGNAPDTDQSAADRTLLFDLAINRLREHAASVMTASGNADEARVPTTQNTGPQEALLQRAGSLARTPEQQVSYRLAGATLARFNKDFGRIVTLYQQILDEPAWSNVRIRLHDVSDADDDGPGGSGSTSILTAGKLATRSIERTLDLAGDRSRAAYAPIEARAQADLDRARAAGPDAAEGTPVALFAIAQHYPNAKAAKDAVALAGQLLTRPGGPPADRHALRDMAAHAPDANARLAVSEAMLRSYLAENNTAGALGRARRLSWQDATRAFSGSLPDLADGTSLNNASNPTSAIDRLQAVTFDRQERQLPDMHASYAGNSFDVDHTVDAHDVARLLLPADLTNRGGSRSNARNDRIVALSRGPEPKLLVFKPGQAQPLVGVDWRTPGTNAAVVPTWLSADRLLMRQQDRVATIDVAGGQIAWSIDVAALDAAAGDAVVSNQPRPTNGEAGSRVIELDDSGVALLQGTVSPGVGRPPESNDPWVQQIQAAVARGEMDPAMARQLIAQAARTRLQAQRQQIIVRNGGRIRINGNVRINGRVFVNGQPVVIDDNGDIVDTTNGPWQPDPRATPDAAEQIVEARVGGGGATDTIIVATSRGRVFGLDAKSGNVRWRATVGDRAPAYVGIFDERVVLATTDEHTASLVVLDATDGSEALRRDFADSASGGSPGQRITNVALGDEGFAVVAQPDTLTLMDIAGGDPEPVASQQITLLPSSTTNSGNPGAGDFDGSSIQFCGDRVLVLATAPTGGAEGAMPVVRALNLGSLTPVTATDARTSQSAMQQFVPAYADNRRRGDEPIELRVHKDRLFILTGKWFKSYPVLDAKQLPWARTPDTPTMLTEGSPMLVREGVVTVGWPLDNVGGSSPSARLELYSRQTVDGSQEVGMLAEEIELIHRGGRLINQAFQPVDGGLYYLSTDGTLVFLPGKSGQ